jgi:ceramide glucosyltransferase
MDYPPTLLQWFFLFPVAAGSVFLLLCVFTLRRFCRSRRRSFSPDTFSPWPPVTILKPVCGFEKNLRENLRSACIQDYPDFQVVFSVQDSDDPALPVLGDLRKEFPERVSVVIEKKTAGPNGKVNNLLGALTRARHGFLVISDSDVRLRPDYLKAMIAPLADPDAAFVCTPYRVVAPERWFERLEALTLNADFIPSVIFAYVTGAARFCLGSSVAFRRRALEEAGGFEGLADYLAEDYEMGSRLLRGGKKMVLIPYFVELTVDLKDLGQWWRHQITWDQKTRSAQPAGFFAGVITRSVPFAFFFAAVRMGDPLGLGVLGLALLIRLGTAAIILGMEGSGGQHGKSLALLPVRDLAALVSWALALAKKTVVWRGSKLVVTRRGRLAGPGVHP